ncbi:TcpE family conjugal transfer membrane protein [Lactococcus garvieae]
MDPRDSFKGKLYWSFQTPISVPFIGITLISALLIFLIVVHPLISVLQAVPFIPVGLCTVVPWKIGKLYVEYEPDGKKLHHFIFGTLRFIKDFGFDTRGIYGQQRRHEVEEK